MDVRLFIGMVLFSAAPLHAQQIYKCTEKGATTYQSQPCQNGAAVKTWEYDASAAPARRYERPSTPSTPVAPRERSAMRAVSAQPEGGRLHHISQYREPDRCQQAKAQRAATFEAAGIRRTYELSRQMDDLVFAACK